MLWSDLIIGGEFERRHYMCPTLEDVPSLAQAFAPVVKLENRPPGHEKKRFNLALEAMPNAGKSTFTDALLGSGIKILKTGGHEQFVGMAEEFGRVVRADTHHMMDNWNIMYKTRNPLLLGVRSMWIENGLDIVEHAIWSGRLNDFHAVICIRREFGEGQNARSLELFASKIVQSMPSYQEFINQAAPFSYVPKPQEDTPWKLNP